jgi:hypothetical protein
VLRVKDVTAGTGVNTHRTMGHTAPQFLPRNYRSVILGSLPRVSRAAAQPSGERADVRRKFRLVSIVRSKPGTGTTNPVGEALAHGDIDLEQARVIVDAVDDLPTDLVDPGLRARAGRDPPSRPGPRARRHGTQDLGRRILEPLAPDIAEAHEQRVLDEDEKRAAQKTRLTLADDGHGTTHGCDWPPALGHARHDTPWAKAATPPSTTAPPLPRHHARAHDPTYDTTHLPGGEVAFTRRTWVPWPGDR